MKLFYDFHIHSCLSPCGDDDSTPNNIVNMALIKGLNVIALADHNTGKNCPAAIAVGKKNGLVVLPAMELTTSEDIHVLCLFEKYEDLQKLEEHISRTRLRVKNKPHIFGHQRILDENDEPVGEEEDLLIVSSGVSVQEAAALVKGFNGIAIPAHIDKQANSVIAVLGEFDYGLGFTLVECSKEGVVELPRICDSDAHYLCFTLVECSKEGVVELPRICDSDAHYLWDISEAEHFIEADTCSAHGVMEALRKMSSHE